MRFQLHVQLWMDVESVAEAQSTMTRVHCAAEQALGSVAARDPGSGANSIADLTGVDAAALAALAADDLGSSIKSASFTAGREGTSDT